MRFSIITINYNNCVGLHSTVKSVIKQDFDSYEYIVIDGGSVDGSVDLLDQYSAEIDYAVSERDNGIYHAMNKGIAAVKGEYVIFMNSGDQFFDESTLSVYNSYIDDESEIYYGNVEGVNMENTRDIIYPETLNLSHWLFDTIGHQASIIKRSLFTNHGFYNENSKITADWQFFAKMFLVKQVQFKYINRKLAIVDLNGISSNPEWRDLQQKERDDFIQNELPQFWKEYLFIKDTRSLRFKSNREEKLRLIKANKVAYRMLKMNIDFLGFFLKK